MLEWWYGGAIPRLPELLLRPAGMVYIPQPAVVAGITPPSEVSFAFPLLKGSCQVNPSSDTASPVDKYSRPRL